MKAGDAGSQDAGGGPALSKIGTLNPNPEATLRDGVDDRGVVMIPVGRRVGFAGLSHLGVESIITLKKWFHRDRNRDRDRNRMALHHCCSISIAISIPIWIVLVA
jgi:hypothetical protein